MIGSRIIILPRTIVIIQLTYLCAETTARRPITDIEHCGYRYYIMDKHNIKSKTNYRQALEEKTH
jgi:hypothetical protein